MGKLLSYVPRATQNPISDVKVKLAKLSPSKENMKKKYDNSIGTIAKDTTFTDLSSKIEKL